MIGSNTRDYKHDTGENLYRRSMYTFWKRRLRPPASMESSTPRTRDLHCLRRERTNTPLQALVTLNDPQFVEAARVLAEKAIKTSARRRRRTARLHGAAAAVPVAPADGARDRQGVARRRPVRHYQREPEGRRRS